MLKIKYVALFFILTFLLQNCSNLRLSWYQSTNNENNNICLTFDDGPNGIATEKLLDVLDKYNAPATFFIIGENAEKYPDLIKRISNKYNIGNHSYYHDIFFFNMSEEYIKTSINKTNDIIYKITGVFPRFFRAPNGLVNNKIDKISKELNMTLVGTNIFINDPMLITEEVIYKKLISKIKKGSNIIVLHDGFGTINNPNRIIVAQALDKLIPKLKKKGFSFKNLDNIGNCN
ncbi:MAG: polysaccharide deacetylase family protein [Candidatus Sericytochromatia bacterium]